MAEAAAFPVVGLGASAGGLEALDQFFRSAPAHPTRMAFVIIVHLDPSRESLLVDILRRSTALSVVAAADGQEVKPDCVYVLQAGTILTMANGRLCSRPLERTRREPNPIDIFFGALASDVGERAVGIVLSGAGADGTLGLKAIKQRGGLTIAQGSNGTAPQHPEMPASAIASGVVDAVLPVEQMFPKLIDYGETLNRLDRLVADEGEPAQRAEEARLELYQLLRNQVGHDFSGYKLRTFMRRVQRRMQVVQIEELPAYVARLRQDPEEVGLLFRDLLIGVTDFFRDPEPFEALATDVIPKLFDGKGRDDTVRVWVPGCATGEEAYSIAILVREYMDKVPVTPRVQVFATDIDEAALTVARAGRYPGALMQEIGPERLAKFFAEDNSSYTVNRDIRDMCIFSPHSIIRDPPFSRIDLISCRNLLIYLGPELQSRVLPLFHYALRPGGFLFLGTAENVTQRSHLFAPINKKLRIFQRRETEGGAPLPIFLHGVYTPRPTLPIHRDPAVVGHNLRRTVEQRVLDRFAPAFVVTDQHGELSYVSANTGRYLEQPGGPPTRQLFAMARPGLQLQLRAALREAVEARRAVTREPVRIRSEEGERVIGLTVEPVDNPQSEPRFLVVFREMGNDRGNDPKGPGWESTDERVEQLERELRETGERLQGTIEEYETSAEELKSANEELVSLNEELQSTNEELETSKEELQSINEELHTVNLELHSKIDQLDRANSDIRNLFDSTEIPTILLDKDLLLRNFTPAATKIFHLISGDKGRPLTDIATPLDYGDVASDCRAVLDRRAPLERNVSQRDGRAHYLMRVRPYLDSDNSVDGIVLIFIDVTERAEAEAAQSALLAQVAADRARLQGLLEQVPVGVLLAEAPAGRIVFSSATARRLFERDWPGLDSDADFVKRGALKRGGSPYRRDELPLARALRGERVIGEEMRMPNGNGAAALILSVNAAPVRNPDGTVVSAIMAFQDVTERQQAIEHQKLLLDELNHRVKNMLTVVLATASETLDHSPDLIRFRQAFLGRMEAMGKTYGLLTRDNWHDVSLEALVREELLPHGSADRVTITGPPVRIWPKAALAFGMVLHELATNAVKYGALSSLAGTVEVAWSAQAGRLELRWMERGGPRIAPPTSKGFGSDLIEQTIGYELDGATRIAFPPEGMEAHFSVPMADGSVMVEIDPPQPREG